MTARVIRPATILKAYFSRASTATYIGSDGLLKTAAVNERRPNYVAGVQEGWVYEPAAATNLLTYSAAFDNAAWTKTACTAPANSVSGVFGTTTADTLLESVGAAEHFLYRDVAMAASKTYTYSVYAKALGARCLILGVKTRDNTYPAGTFDLTNGTVMANAGAYPAAVCTVEGPINGFYRCAITFAAGTGATTPQVFINTGTSAGARTTTGTGSTGLYLEGTQLEAGGLSSHIPTTTAAASRAAEVSNNATRELVSTNAVETVPLWSAGTAYTLGQQVRRDATQRIYENQLAGTNAEVPETVASTRWLDVAPTNTMAMFDQEVGSITKATNSIDVVLRPGAISGLGLQELSNANSVHVVMRETPGGTVVLDTWIDLEYAQIMDHYDWAYLPYEARTDALLVALPEFPNCELTVNIVGSGEVGCGLLLVGEDVELGYSEWGLSLGRKNFSTFQEVRGRTKVVKGTSARKMDTKVWVPAIGRAKFERLLKEVKDTACLWIGEDGPGYETTCVYGIYRDYTLVLSTVEEDLLNLQVEGFP